MSAREIALNLIRGLTPSDVRVWLVDVHRYTPEEAREALSSLLYSGEVLMSEDRRLSVPKDAA